MDSRLDRYLDQQDSEYSTYLDDTGYPVSPQDEATYLQAEIRGIEKIMATDDKYSLVTPAEWYDRMAECRQRLKALLEQELVTLQGTSHLHCQGLIQCHTRRIEIEAQLQEVGVQTMKSFRQQARAMLIDQHYDEHTLPDPSRPYYRECVNCGHAFKKTETALLDYKGRFFCDDKCIQEREEGLQAMHEERLFQESREGGY